VYDERTPADFERLLGSRGLSFEAAYASGYDRVFRARGTKPAKATLIPKLKMIVFGYLFYCPDAFESKLDRHMEVDKGVRTRRLIEVGHGDGDLTSAYAYFLSSSQAFKEPEREDLKKIAEWTTRFWPKTEDEPTKWTEIAIR
jgi:hypothetical protein